MFRTRETAGVLLAKRLEHLRGQELIVLALPRGGLPVGRSIASHLRAKLDVLVARKIAAPAQPEFAVGAVTARGTEVWNEQVLRRMLIPPGYLAEQVEAQRMVARERERALRGDRPAPELAGKVVVLADDGIATGMTVQAAIAEVRRAGARRIVVAAPVVAPETFRVLEALVDEVVALEVPSLFFAVGQFYEDFHQLDDEEARRHLRGVFHENLE